MATKSIIKNIEISDPAEAEKLVKALEEAKKICDGAHFCVEGCETCNDNEDCDFSRAESEEGMEKLYPKSIELTKNLIKQMKNVDGASVSLEVGEQLIDTIEAKQQEIERLRAELADLQKKYTVRIDCTNPQCGANINAYSSKAEAAKVWNRRPAPENKPLTLEQLRGMDGEPVWITLLNDPDDPENGYWRLCWGFETRLSDGKCVLNTHMGPDLYEFDYGRTWLAYREKLEED